jgi:cytidylate kinase
VAAEVTPGTVWLITGAQASGKSTVADLLANPFDRGVHIRGGQFYRWAVRGWVHAGDPRRAPRNNPRRPRPLARHV